MDGGLSIAAWLKLWLMCHAVMTDGILRIGWPDGRCAVEQPAITVAVFDLIGSVVAEGYKSDGK